MIVFFPNILKPKYKMEPEPESELEPEPEPEPELEPEPEQEPEPGPYFTMEVDDISCGKIEGHYPPLFPLTLWKLLRLILSRIFFEQRFHVDEIQKMSVRSSGMCPEPILKMIGFEHSIKLEHWDDRLREHMRKIGIKPTRDDYGNSYWYDNSDMIQDWLEKKQNDDKELLKSQQRLAFAKFLSPRLGSHSLIQDIDVFELVQRGFEDQQYHSLSWTELNYFKKLSSHFKFDLFCKFKIMAEMAKINVFHRDIFDRTIQELNQEITKISIVLFNFKRDPYNGIKKEKHWFEYIVRTYENTEEFYQKISLIWEYNKDFFTQFVGKNNRLFETSNTLEEYCRRKMNSINTSNKEDRLQEKAYRERKLRYEREMAPFRDQLTHMRQSMKYFGHF